MQKILVIENEDNVREIVFEILHTEGFEVIQAENGAIGVQLAQQHLPGLIICDIMMPELDGHGVLNQLQQNPTTRAIPFIFLSAKAANADRRTGMNLGADDYLTKPFTMTELLDAVKARLAKHFSVQNEVQTLTESLQQTQAQLKEIRGAEIQKLSENLQQAKAQLNDLLYQSHLANLPNQLTLQEQFDWLLQQSRLGWKSLPSLSPQFIPVFCLRLDRFDRIEESWGREFGDRLLVEVAERLDDCIPNDDIVAYLNTDEFAIVLSPVRDKTSAAVAAQEILNCFVEPFCLDGSSMFMTGSIGIAACPQDGCSLDKLLQCSRKAIVKAQQYGGNQYKFYDATDRTTAADRLTLENDLRYALERGELQLYYQPQVSLETDRIVGAEALLRWHHPERGAISPGTFIPLAEETGLIEPIGEWVLRTACQQAKIWHEEGYGLLRMAANLSARQFNQAKLPLQLNQILKDTALDPTYLELELTESMLVENPEMAIDSLERLKAIGIEIAIDDFGTGYSSLSYLQKFPFDSLKIDRCFVRDIDTNPKNAAIANAIIAMANQMQLKTIAEGVETAAELAFFREHQCNEIQGYLFSRPLPAPEFEELVRAGKNL